MTSHPLTTELMSLLTSLGLAEIDPRVTPALLTIMRALCFLYGGYLACMMSVICYRYWLLTQHRGFDPAEHPLVRHVAVMSLAWMMSVIFMLVEVWIRLYNSTPTWRLPLAILIFGLTHWALRAMTQHLNQSMNGNGNHA